MHSKCILFNDLRLFCTFLNFNLIITFVIEIYCWILFYYQNFYSYYWVNEMVDNEIEMLQNIFKDKYGNPLISCFLNQVSLPFVCMYVLLIIISYISISLSLSLVFSVCIDVVWEHHLYSSSVYLLLYNKAFYN